MNNELQGWVRLQVAARAQRVAVQGEAASRSSYAASCEQARAGGWEL